METIIFFKWLGLTSLILALIFGVGYWINVALKRYFPDWKFWFKYKVFRRKFNEEVINFLAEDLENGIDTEEMSKAILLSGKVTLNQAGELKYIYKELKRRYDNE